MACYYRQHEDTTVTVPKFTNENSSGGVTYYDIKLRVGKVEWLVERRYRDFAQLHDKLVGEISISKKLLPPKKLVGNRQPAFLEQRREQLETYLQELLIYFRTELPRALAEFLDFNKYDIIYLLQDLAKLFNESGDALLSSKKEYNLSALELRNIFNNLVKARGINYSLGTLHKHHTSFSAELEKTINSEISFNNIRYLYKYVQQHCKWYQENDCVSRHYFNYLLLDPRSLDEVNSIALVKDPKLALIVSIWRAKRGVLLIQAFQDISSEDAQTREASIIDALSMNHLTNRRLGVYCGPARSSLSSRERNLDRGGKFDFSHVLDFCTQLVALVVTPVKDNASYAQDYNTVDVPIGRSNIIPNRLNFNLNAFRNLKTLKFSALSTENITICVHNTTIQNINQVLLCDNLHKDCDVPSLLPEAIIASSSGCSPSTSNGSALLSADAWQEITELDLTGNLLTQIDGSLLSLSGNLIAECVDWHLTMGNLVTLKLAQNKIKTLSGLRKLLSLVNLDLSSNQIEELDEVDHVANLPLLETLRLTGNPLAGSTIELVSWPVSTNVLLNYLWTMNLETSKSWIPLWFCLPCCNLSKGSNRNDNS
ncbi:hypothetical protein M5D96_007464 [Drosophila gunungcola]|uniref:PX domain-containing protein n=1 Tax=Drosophila gunungcola TaxID=103775 RepID=A0A9Q0BQG6_9MUSC|nr:hypothetical protein M5D96_007464 [Drosophila gunungcola]